MTPCVPPIDSQDVYWHLVDGVLMGWTDRRKRDRHVETERRERETAPIILPAKPEKV